MIVIQDGVNSLAILVSNWSCMERNILWTQREEKEGGADSAHPDIVYYWEPRSLDNPEGELLPGLPIWRRTVDFELMNVGVSKEYFDGIFDCGATLISFFVRNQNGIVSDNWVTKKKSEKYPIRKTADFVIIGEYLFIDVDDVCEEQYLTTIEKSAPLRRSWFDELPKNSSGADNSFDTDDSSNTATCTDLPQMLEKMKSAVESRPTQTIRKAASPVPTANTGTNADTDTSKLGYWKAFVAYAFENQSSSAFVQSGFPQAEPADRNWYALRLGSAKTHIELTFNSKKGTIRTALFTKDSDWFDRLIANEAQIEQDFREIPGTITWDGASKSSSVSIIREVSDLNRDREEQFDWFMECACILKRIAADYFSI